MVNLKYGLRFEYTEAGDDAKISVLFVCLGNICRSPLAGAVFAHVVQQRGLTDHFGQILSSGTSDYHIGELPDERTTATCQRHGVPINSTARQVTQSDFRSFDYIVAMDDQNLANLRRIEPADSTARVSLFGAYGDNQVIKDPYYGRGEAGFEKCYEQCLRYSEGLLSAMGFSLAADSKITAPTLMPKARS